MNTKSYTGIVSVRRKGDNDAALFVGLADEPLADILQNVIAFRTVTVRYWVSDTKKTKHELVESVLRNLSGDVDAMYSDRYSEITGYLWTDEYIKVGGHDLIRELRSYVGKYVYLEIDIHDEPAV